MSGVSPRSCQDVLDGSERRPRDLPCVREFEYRPHSLGPAPPLDSVQLTDKWFNYGFWDL